MTECAGVLVLFWLCSSSFQSNFFPASVYTVNFHMPFTHASDATLAKPEKAGVRDYMYKYYVITCTGLNP